MLANNENDRLAALASYAVLDTAPELAFDRITRLAADLFQAPIALVSLVDENRQWFKSRVGLDACSTPREQAFCSHAIELGPHAVMVVENAELDARFADNPLVVDAPNIRFYAGATLTTRDGHNLGTLCVIDTKPRARPKDEELERLQTLAAIVVDEFELLRANRQSAEKQHLLELAESMSLIGHWRLDLKSGGMDWSEAVYAMHGVDRDFEPTLESAREFHHLDDRDRISLIIRGAIDDKSSFQAQARIICPDGSMRHIQTCGVCQLNEHSEVSGVYGLSQDITEQTKTLEAAEFNLAQYQLLADHSTDIIVRFGKGGVISYASPAIRELGMTPADAIGKRTVDFTVPEDREFALKSMNDLFSGEEPNRSIRREYRVPRADGSIAWLEGNPSIIRDANGEPIEVVTNYRDITARRELEDKLEQACRTAEAATRAKAEFLATMSHELRTPLTAILGGATLLGEDASISKGSREYVELISTAGDALLTTVNDILDFSALESGRLAIKRAPASPGAIVTGVTSLLSQLAADKMIAIQAHGLDDLPDTLDLAANRVRQILINLVGNAVKFTDKGRVDVKVRYEQSRSMLTFRVKDTGPGIAPADLEKLFQRFSQLDGSSTRKHGGSGLGLAICKGLVEAMGGDIGVTSQPGEGSEFWFSLPAAECGVRDPTDGAAVGNFLADPRRHILVVDDNRANRTLLDAVLGSFGAKVSMAGSGMEAVVSCAFNNYDLILMDLLMPGLDGCSAARQIRSPGGRNAMTPIIAVSADLSCMPEAGIFDAAAQKPIDVQALAETLGALLPANASSNCAASA